ncbi:MAG: hypothetical protein HDR92_01155 [Bacteroides sp.]|nr:hypothetical protein [Bacteroides sp.]
MKLHKIAASLFVLAAVAFSSCSEGQYWDEPGDKGSYCAFPKAATTLSIPAADTMPTSYDVLVTRSNAGAEASYPITFKSSSPLLTGPSSVTFAAGQTQATYTISIGSGAKAGITYSATLEINNGSDQIVTIPSANLKYTFTISKVLVLDWQPAGTAFTISESWVGNADPVEIPVEEAVNWPTDGQRRMRLMSPYWYLEPDFAEKGHNIEFFVDTDYNALSMYATYQYIGESNDGEYYFFGCPANYGGSFTNQGDVYIMDGVMGYAASPTGSVSAGWYETLMFQWKR